MDPGATMIRFTRTEPGRPPRTAGLEVDDAGEVVGWETAGDRVGRFGRTLLADELEALRGAVETAAAAAPGDLEVAAPGGAGASEQVNADGVGVFLDAGAEPPALAADLVALLRELHVDLLGHPVAALELHVSGSPTDPGTAALRHLGEEALVVRTGGASARASVFDAGSAVVDQSATTVEVDVDGPVDPGWTHPLSGLEVGAPVAGGFRTVKVDGVAVDVDGSGVPRPVELVWMDGDDGDDD
ncbi:hypothetical protein [Nocardioides sp.]|uniref:hypothetical protein n=1 Tax=Nocardioides sp. TaxID=35761 RepID=UPI002728BEE5|nr:hypothetical protein [Nocardioides sp.]MDO9456256.1 hypothetical protein [Nocardioides sp.]